MKGKDSGEAKGYAFVTFRNKELASKAIEELNNSQLKVISTFGQFSSLIIATVSIPGFGWLICAFTFVYALPFLIYFLNPSFMFSSCFVKN